MPTGPKKWSNCLKKSSQFVFHQPESPLKPSRYKWFSVHSYSALLFVRSCGISFFQNFSFFWRFTMAHGGCEYFGYYALKVNIIVDMILHLVGRTPLSLICLAKKKHSDENLLFHGKCIYLSCWIGTKKCMEANLCPFLEALELWPDGFFQP